MRTDGRPDPERFVGTYATVAGRRRNARASSKRQPTTFVEKAVQTLYFPVVLRTVTAAAVLLSVRETQTQTVVSGLPNPPHLRGWNLEATTTPRERKRDR